MVMKITSRALKSWTRARFVQVPSVLMPNSSGQRILRFADGPLVWVDLEMTGLNPQKDKILEIAVLITNGNLDVVDDGIDFVIKTEKVDLDGMDEWCTRQHGSSGLTQACINSPHSHEFVKSSVLSYIQRWIPDPHVGVLAGNSIHVDRTFLANYMSEITDVSSIKELSRRWYPDASGPNVDLVTHRAMDDIKRSIRELKWYRERIFVPPMTPRTPPVGPQ